MRELDVSVATVIAVGEEMLKVHTAARIDPASHISIRSVKLVTAV